jgi:hypothetical protein
MTLANAVRLNLHTTDVDTLVQHVSMLTERFQGTGERFASTLLAFARLAGPRLLVGLEASTMD